MISCLPIRKMIMPDIVSNMKSDKKRMSGRQKYVLLTRPGNPQIADRVDMKFVKRAIDHMLAEYYQKRVGRA